MLFKSPKETLLYADASVPSGDTIASTADETDFVSTFTFPAYSLLPLDVIRVTAFGIYSTTGSPTMAIRLRWGGLTGVTLLSTGTVTMGASQTNRGWKFDGLLMVPAAGLAFEAQGFASFALTGVTATPVHLTNVDPVPVDVDTAMDLTLTAEWSVSSASNIIILRQILMHRMRL